MQQTQLWNNQFLKKKKREFFFIHICIIGNLMKSRLQTNARWWSGLWSQMVASLPPLDGFVVSTCFHIKKIPLISISSLQSHILIIVRHSEMKKNATKCSFYLKKIPLIFISSSQSNMLIIVRHSEILKWTKLQQHVAFTSRKSHWYSYHRCSRTSW